MPAKKLLFVLILFSACSSRIERSKFDQLYRSIKTIEAATTTGVNYARFGEAVQAAATELSVARDHATNETERKLVELYGAIVEIYSDSLHLWGEKISTSGKFPKMGMSFVLSPGAKLILSKYNLGTFKWPDYSIELAPNETLQYLWAAASNKTAAANSFYLGTEIREPAQDLARLKDSIYASAKTESDDYK